MLKYDTDFLGFCDRALQKDFNEQKSLSLKIFLQKYLKELALKQENSLLFPLKGDILGKNKNFAEEIFDFFLENYHFRYINELKYLKLHCKTQPTPGKKSICLIDNEGNFVSIDQKAEDLFDLDQKELRNGNLFKLMTPISKFLLFGSKSSQNMKVSLISEDVDVFRIEYTLYSKKAFRGFLKFATEDRFDFLRKDADLSGGRGESVSSLEELRKNELRIKFLKPLCSRFTRLQLKLQEKLIFEAAKTHPRLEIGEMKETDENCKLKPIYLVETEESVWDCEQIDYNLMANDKKIMEWEGFSNNFSFYNILRKEKINSRLKVNYRFDEKVDSFNKTKVEECEF